MNNDGKNQKSFRYAGLSQIQRDCCSKKTSKEINPQHQTVLETQMEWYKKIMKTWASLIFLFISSHILLVNKLSYGP